MIGYYVGFSIFLALNSVEFCNTWIFSDPRVIGLIQLSDLYSYWGCFTIIFSVFILVFKSEKTPIDFEEFSFTEVYSMALNLFTLPHFKVWMLMVMIR